MKIQRLIFLPLAFFLVSCTAVLVKTGYDNLDWLFVNEIDDYFDASAEQEAFLDGELVGILKWHRTGELPVYKKFLEDFKAGLRKEKLEEADLDDMRKRILGARNRAIDRAQGMIVGFLASVSAEQMDHLEKRLAEYNEEEEEDIDMTRDEFFEARLKRSAERFEDAFGEITPEQEALLKEKGDFSPDKLKRRAEQRRVYQKAFVDFMRNSPSEREINDTVPYWLKNPHVLQSEEFQRRVAERTEKSTRMTIAMHATLTDAQKDYFADQIDEYIGYIDALIEN